MIREVREGVRNATQRKLLNELGIPAEDVPVDQFIPVSRMLDRVSAVETEEEVEASSTPAAATTTTCI